MGELEPNEKKWVKAMRQKHGVNPNIDSLSRDESGYINLYRNPPSEVAEPKFFDRAQR
jgi:hypothetical protein